MVRSASNERRHVRKTCITPFAYRVPPRVPSLLIGITSNISDSGMCIYSDNHLNEREDIEIRSSLPVPYIRATVRWIKKDAADLYKMGLMFVE
jgi:hypothetical protein